MKKNATTLFERLKARHSAARFKADMLFIADTSVLAAFFCSLTSFLPYEVWLVDMASQFQFQYFFLGLFGLGYAFVTRRGRAAMFGLLCVISSLYFIAPYYVPGRSGVSGAEELRVFAGNVLTRNKRYAEVIAEIRRQKPDIAVFTEIDSMWFESLKELKSELPHFVAVPREDNFGIAIFSRLPIANGIELKDAAMVSPVLSAEVNFGGRPLVVVAAHPPPPGLAAVATLRDKQLSALAEIVRERKETVILAGDLNTTAWSIVGRRFLAESGLRDSRRGFGVLATFPSFALPFGFPIDHVLATPELTVRGAEAVDIPGSDHGGIIVVFSR